MDPQLIRINSCIGNQRGTEFVAAARTRYIRASLLNARVCNEVVFDVPQLDTIPSYFDLAVGTAEEFNRSVREPSSVVRGSVMTNATERRQANEPTSR
jgi:hypothetical protein